MPPTASAEYPSNPPVYVSGGQLGTANAIFDNGAIVNVEHGRGRAYPNLLSEAPPTAAFYAAVKAAAPHAKRVLDVGCGSGIGTRLLTRDFESVVGLDSDATALAFAREYASLAELVRCDLQSAPNIEPGDAAIVCDLLGHVADPTHALRSIRAALVPGAPLVIAEPRAYPVQHLRAPVERAFSERSLASLLTQSGFTVQSWLQTESSFLSCVAVATEDGSHALFEEASAALLAGKYEVAINAYQRIVDLPTSTAQGEALILMASALLNLRDAERAVGSLLAASEITKNDPRVLSGLSQIALLTGSPRDALELAVSASEADATYPRAWKCLAESSAALGEHTGSFTAWRIAAALAPADREITTELARAAAEREDFKYAVAALERLRGYHAELGADFHVTLGWLLTLAGRRADATLEARHALLLAPKGERALDLARQLQAT
jgi:SAM-dependent methyltransferase